MPWCWPTALRCSAPSPPACWKSCRYRPQGPVNPLHPKCRRCEAGWKNCYYIKTKGADMNTQRFKQWLTLAGLCCALGAGSAMAAEKITYAYQMDPMYEAALWALKNGKVKSDNVQV